MLAGFHTSSTKLLNVNQASGATAQTGTVYKVRGSNGDQITTDQQVFKFIATTQFNGGATTPTGQVKVQGSVDNVNWIDIATGAAQTSDDAVRTELVGDVQNAVLLPFIRAVTVLAGGTAPTKQVVNVSIVSNADFTIETV